MPFLATADTTLHYDHRPADPGAPTLVFSNSLGTDLRIWAPLVAALEPGFGVLRYDTRGHGLSDLGPAERAAIHAGDVAALLDALSLARVVLVGLSVGGVIAQRFAVDHAARLEALVLVCTGARVGTRHDWEARIASVRSEGVGSLAPATMERWFSPGFRASEPALMAGLINMVGRQPVAGYAALCAMLRDTDLTGEIAAIKVPTLAISGALDLATPPALLQAIADTVADGRHLELSGLSHMAIVEAPHACAEAITTFLREKGRID